MKKQSLYSLIFLLTVFILIAFFAFENKTVTTNVQTYSSLFSEDLESIASSRKKDDSLLLDLRFNDTALFYDPGSSCYYYSLPEDQENASDPDVSWDSDTLKVSFENKPIDKGSVAANENIGVLIYDEDRYTYKTLKCTTLPLININKFYDDPSFTYDKSVISFYDNRTGELETYDGKVRIRGGLTAELDKPGLRIELDNLLKGDNNTEEKYYEIFGLEKDNEFVLYTCNVEKDHIRNVFSTNLWYETCADDNSFGLKLGMSYRLCEVFINNKYWGLCALGNPISKKRNYVVLDEDSDAYLLENIYKMNFFGNRELLDYEKFQKDFLMEIKTNVNKVKAWEPYTQFIRLLNESNDKEALYESVDLDNALDIYLFYDLIQAWDNAWFEDELKFRNTYLISKMDDDGNIRMLYIPWDLDRSWGHCREDGLEYPMDYTLNYPMVVTPIENLLAIDDTLIKDLLYQKYIKLRNEEWSDEAIFSMLDSYEEQIYGSGAFFRDKDRWPDNYHADNEDLKEFKEYVRKRIEYFDVYMEETYGDAIMKKN